MRYVSQRGLRFHVRWREEGKLRLRTFRTYEEACAFARDYVIPYRERRAIPPSLAAPGKGAGWVYIFQSNGPDEPVKIGWSRDPATRLRDLNTAHAYGINLVGLLPGTRALEKALHEHLSGFRLNGEWFSREAIDSLSRLLLSTILEPPLARARGESDDLQQISGAVA